MQWKQYLAGLCGFVFGFWMCMPRNMPLLPRYEVLVVDATGKGLPTAHVEQLREDYAVTNAVSSSFATADSYGRVAFPPVSARTSPLRRTVLCARRKVAHGLHAPCGYRNEITVDIPGYIETTRSEGNVFLKSRGRLLHITMRATNPGS